MKRSLALACAAVALTAGSGAANAQAKFDVIVGGDAYFQAGYVNQDQDAGLRSTEMRNRFRFVLTPTAKADNGLEYGARLRVRADASSTSTARRNTSTDRAFIFAKGVFGTVQAGTINGLSDEYGFIGPNLEGIAGGADNGTLDFLSGSAIYDFGVAGRATNFRNLRSGDIATRLVYLTPTFAGFQAGISYAPRSDDNNNAVARNKYVAASTYQGSFHDMVEVGAIYTREIGPVAIEASGFYEFGDAAKDPTGGRFKDLSSYNIAANVGFAGAKIGAMYRNAGDSGYCRFGCSGKDQETWIVGANYTLGPVILAANYQRYEDAGADPATGGNGKLDLYQAGVTYTVAPGLTTGLEYSYFRARDNDLPAPFNRDKGSIVMLDTRLAF
jgi:predicted porin